MKTALLLFAVCFLCACSNGEIAQKQKAPKAKNRCLIPENATYLFKNKFGDTLTLDKRRIPGFQNAVWIFRGDTLHEKNKLDNTKYRLLDGTPFRASFNYGIDDLLGAFFNEDEHFRLLSSGELNSLFCQGKSFKLDEKIATTYMHEGKYPCFPRCYIRRLQLDDDDAMEYIVEFDESHQWHHLYSFYNYDGSKYRIAYTHDTGNREFGPDRFLYDAKSKYFGLCDNGWGSSGFTLKTMTLYTFENKQLKKLLPSHTIDFYCFLFGSSVFGGISSEAAKGQWKIINNDSIVFTGNYILSMENEAGKITTYIFYKQPYSVTYKYNKYLGRFSAVEGDIELFSDTADVNYLSDRDISAHFEPELINLSKEGTALQQYYIRRYFKNKQKP